MPTTLQRALVFPGSLLPAPPPNRLTPSVRHIAGPDGRRIALYHRGGRGDLHVLFFYGNAMTVADCGPIIDGFSSIAAGVSIPDYPGYGLSDGSPSERSCYAAAEHVVHHLAHEHGIAAHRLVIAGWSLGAAVAMHAALRHEPLGLIMFSPFTSLAAAARQVVSLMPAALAGALIGGAFDNASNVRSLRCPLLLAHGEHDRLLPLSMSEELYAIAAKAGRRVQLVEVPRADHADLFAVGGAALWRHVEAFLQALPRSEREEKG